MARAIKAVLANRKMFRGGGLTDTAPAASGILSSSSPLIDAVTADAVNPQGGGTLSMNQGGVARFQYGGLGTIGRNLPSMMQPAAMEELPAITSESDWYAQQLSGDIKRQIAEDVRRLSEAQRSGDRALENQVLDAINEKYRTDSKDPTSGAKVFGSLVNEHFPGQSVEEIISTVGGLEIGESLIASEEPVAPTEAVPITQPTAMEAMVTPESVDIVSAPPPSPMETAVPVRGIFPPGAGEPYDISPTPVPSEVLMAENVPTPLIEPQIKSAPEPAGMTVEDVVAQDALIQKPDQNQLLPPEASDSPALPGGGSLLSNWSPGKALVEKFTGPSVLEQRRAAAATLDPLASATEPTAADIAAAEQFPTSIAIDQTTSVTRSGEESAVVQKPPSEVKTAGEETAADTTTGQMTLTELTAAGLDVETANAVLPLINGKGMSVAEALESLAESDSSLKSSTTVEVTPGDSDEPSAKSPVEALYSPNPAFNVAAAQKEFVDAMPEYSDKSTSGLNLLMLGLAIAAGKSDDPITNVSQGALAVLPQFIEDAKEREKYIRSINLSGGQYAFTKRDTLGAEERSAERAKNNYMLDNDITFKDANGQIVERFRAGVNRLNDRQVEAIQRETGIQLIPEAWWIADAEAKAASAAARFPYMKTVGTYKTQFNKRDIELDVIYPSAHGAEAEAKPILLNPEKLVLEYEKGLSALGGMTGLVTFAKGALNEEGTGEEISGFDALIGKGKDIYRAFVRPESGLFTSTENLSPEELEQYNQFMDKNIQVSATNRYHTYLRMLSIQMAPLLLGESGKTISDRDRMLVASALGMAEGPDGKFKWVAGASTSEEQLRLRLGILEGVLARAHGNLDNSYYRTWREFGVEPERIKQAYTPEAVREELVPTQTPVPGMYQDEDGLWHMQKSVPQKRVG
jgi:hypothetical protein